MVSLNRVSLSTNIDMEYAVTGSGSPVILLHGYGDSWYSFNGVMAALPDQIRAIAPSQRGHGNTDKPESGYQIRQYVADVIALMDELGLDQVPIVGHSMGSFIAQEIAITRPDRVTQIVLIASAPTANNEPLQSLLRGVNDLSDPVDRDFIYDFQFGSDDGPLGAGMSKDKVIEESLRVPAHVWRLALAELVSYRQSKPLSEIACPTYILGGENDELFSVSDQHELQRRIPGSTAKIYEGVGHGVQWENPVEVANDLVCFLAQRRA